MLVYSSGEGYMIELQKAEETKTNENRTNIIDKDHATYKAINLIANRIYHKLTGDEIDELYDYENDITYKCGQVVNKIVEYGFNEETVRYNGIELILNETETQTDQGIEYILNDNNNKTQFKWI